MKMTRETLELAQYLLESWQRGADPEAYYMDCCEVLNAITKALADQALDRMADNARELGLDYAPAQTEAERLAKFSEQHNEKMRLYRIDSAGDGELTD